MKVYLYESWCNKLEEENKFAESFAIMQGSFSNPEMARKMIKSQNPDFESDDESYDRTSQALLEMEKEDLKKVKRRRRRING